MTCSCGNPEGAFGACSEVGGSRECKIFSTLSGGQILSSGILSSGSMEGWVSFCNLGSRVPLSDISGRRGDSAACCCDGSGVDDLSGVFDDEAPSSAFFLIFCDRFAMARVESLSTAPFGGLCGEVFGFAFGLFSADEERLAETQSDWNNYQLASSQAKSGSNY